MSMGSTPLDYAPWRATALGAVTERLERTAVLDLAGPLEGRDVLDVGCGDGAYALAAARAGARVAGLDRSADAVGAARARAEAEGLAVDLRVADAGALPFSAARFDVVLAVTVLCFVDEPAQVVAEMTRVLRPGGVLVLGELCRWSVWAAWRRLRAWAGSTTWRAARFWSPEELRSSLRDAGLVPAAERGAAFYPPVGAAARVLEPLDPLLGRATRLGAAFVAIAARKPEGRS
jgi:2-polyprenyl-3-methyl-5-hydroxy-6-metoxy-1,4-benzoquinol methylase